MPTHGRFVHSIFWDRVFTIFFFTFKWCRKICYIRQSLGWQLDVAEAAIWTMDAKALRVE
jgi:hypothetical protein